MADMPPLANPAFAIHPHFPNGGTLTGKQPTRQHIHQRQSAERRIVTIHAEPVGCHRNRCTAGCRRSGTPGMRVQEIRHSGFRLRGCDRPLPRSQALPVLQPAQLLNHGNRNMAVRTDTKTSTRCHELGQREQPSPRLASVVGHNATTAPESAMPCTSAGVRCVACTRVQCASTGA